MKSSSKGSNSANPGQLEGVTNDVNVPMSMRSPVPPVVDNDVDVFGTSYFGGGEESFDVELEDEAREEDENVEDEQLERDEEMDEEDEDDSQVRTSKKRKGVVPPRSNVWTHFQKFVDPTDNVQRGKCKYCSRVLKAGSKKHGTNSLRKHLEICKKKPRAVGLKQPHVVFKPTHGTGGEKEAELVTWQFDQDRARKSLCRMLIIDELPFKTVEKEGFKQLVFDICPMFVIPSRRSVTRDIYNMLGVEREQMLAFIKKNAQRICLTTDTWTSLQRVNYMCLIAHFIDDA